MRILRWLYWIDAASLLIAGLLLAGWSNSPGGMDRLGMTYPGAYIEHLAEWRAVGYAGEFGVALMAFGFATLAIANAKDDGIRRSAIPYFLAAHFFLSFLVWAKTMAFGATPGGLFLVAVAVYPGAGFLYALFSGFSPVRTLAPSFSDNERKICEAAGREERSRLAQDLHDSVKQQVYAIQTTLAAAQARWDTDSSGAREAVARARSTAHDAMAEMIALLDRLRHEPVESVGLITALRRQVEALGYQSGAEVTAEFTAMPAAKQLPAGSVTAVFRMAQEALANVARHARARHVRLQAGIDPESDAISLIVTDDGQGFDPASATTGMGLANIRERAAEIGGWCRIDSSPGNGCRLAVGVPLVDPRRERVWRHDMSVVVSAIILIPIGLLTWAWVESRPYLIPLAALAGMFAVVHAGAAGLLRWRAR